MGDLFLTVNVPITSGLRCLKPTGPHHQHHQHHYHPLVLGAAQHAGVIVANRASQASYIVVLHRHARTCHGVSLPGLEQCSTGLVRSAFLCDTPTRARPTTSIALASILSAYIGSIAINGGVSLVKHHYSWKRFNTDGRPLAMCYSSSHGWMKHDMN